jgi:hypothetical protein
MALPKHRTQEEDRRGSRNYRCRGRYRDGTDNKPRAPTCDFDSRTGMRHHAARNDDTAGAAEAIRYLNYAATRGGVTDPPPSPPSPPASPPPPTGFPNCWPRSASGSAPGGTTPPNDDAQTGLRPALEVPVTGRGDARGETRLPAAD